MSNIPDIDDNPAFDQAYWLHQPPEVQGLQIATDRAARAQDLASKGFLIDVPIMVWGWDPWKVMKLRVQFGYTWVPSALMQPVQNIPGLPAVPGTTPYDPNNPPVGAIKVSMDIADYPPFTTGQSNPPALVTQATDYVGNQSFGNIYISLPGDPTPDGVIVTDARGRFLRHRVQTPFGFNGWYEKLSDTQ